MQEAVSTLPSRKRTGIRGKSRRIQTYQFGEITVSPQHIFSLPDGLIGFSDLHEFVLISEESTEPLKWLLSLENPTIGFPVINPLVLDLGYRGHEGHAEEHSAVLVVVTLANENGSMTANMKAPVLLDVKHQTGRQIIISSDRYSPEYIIADRQH